VIASETKKACEYNISCFLVSECNRSLKLESGFLTLRDLEHKTDAKNHLSQICKFFSDFVTIMLFSVVSNGDAKSSSPPPSFIDLGRERRVYVQYFKGYVVMHIRQWYLKNGKPTPGKGISLNLKEWTKLKANIEKIDEMWNDPLPDNS
jgi:hypothetical protein